MNPNAEETFLSAKLDWDEAGNGAHAEWRELYRRLLELRRALQQIVASVPLAASVSAWPKRSRPTPRSNASFWRKRPKMSAAARRAVSEVRSR